jgi:beta-N-acetylhexosaminidase
VVTVPPHVDPLAALSPAERVGDLFMVGSTATAAEQVTLDAVSSLHVGGVFLSGRSHAGVAATAAVVAGLQAAARASNPTAGRLLVATDQEGGEVQVLNGPGFTPMPTALQQGALTPVVLRSDAHTWAQQLEAAGVNMNLAPVVDFIPTPATAPENPPIGAFQREFGFTASTIDADADAFRTGMATAGITTVIKHFPGLGAVTGNTDTTAGVTDNTTGPGATAVNVFRHQIDAGAPCVMVSLADYTLIAPGTPAVFSRTVVTDLLRRQLGFTGVIISDDLSAATQVSAWSPANRAILAIEAGVDIILVSRNPTVTREMVHAVLTKDLTDPAFAAQVDVAARHVLTLRQR